MRLLLSILWVPLVILLFDSCKKKTPEKPPLVFENVYYFTLDETKKNQLDFVKVGSQHVKITTTGGDPYIQSQVLKQARKEKELVLTFEYKSSAALNHLQVFFGAPVAEDRSVKTGQLPVSSSWKVFSLDVGDELELFKWGASGHFLRFDFGDASGVVVEVRNIRLRERNEQEQRDAEDREAFREADHTLDQGIRDYLNRSYPANITQVAVEANSLQVKGSYPSGESLELVEIIPYEGVVHQVGNGDRFVLDGGSSFDLSIERFIDRAGFRYDRALSQWAIVRQVSGNDELYSHARYADIIQPKRNMVLQKPAHGKGLGGYDYGRGYVEDLDDLGIASATVNITVTSLIYLNERPDTYIHNYAGRTYYINKNYVHSLDATLKATADRNIVVAAIILVQKPSQSADPLVGNLLQDVNYTSDAFFTMPRMDNADSFHCYAATLDFLADRYSRPGNPNGRIHKWIMHNEVDAGSTWTNMGKNRPMNVFLDRYYKSMRLCYNIVREYDEHAEVMASFTHAWAEISPGGDYATKDMLDGLLAYSKAEGDFRWGVAAHPYPQDLNEPKTWNDTKAIFNMNTPIVTFKNLEVLDKWIKQPTHRFGHSEKRTLWLSENGTNSKTYSDQDLLEQAAGFAYAWKKMKELDGIDAMQWHNWMDNRHEFGLRIGLRRFPDDETEPGGKKPVWYAYQAAGTETEDSVFEQYKAIIGIQNWNEIIRQIN